MTVWFLAGCTLLFKAVTWAFCMSSRVMVLEAYGGVHLPGVWSRNGCGGGLWCSSFKEYSLPPPFFPCSPLITMFQTQTPKLKHYFTAWYWSLRWQVLVTPTCSERSKDLTGQLKSSFSFLFPSLYSLLACFLLWLLEVINMRFAIEFEHLVRLLLVSSPSRCPNVTLVMIPFGGVEECMKKSIELFVKKK